MKRLVIYILRKNLGLKKYERFKFTGQKSDACYYFTEDAIMKVWNNHISLSGVSVNWLLNDDCEIERI